MTFFRYPENQKIEVPNKCFGPIKPTGLNRIAILDFGHVLTMRN